MQASCSSSTSRKRSCSPDASPGSRHFCGGATRPWVLAELAAMSIRLSMDDFGTGYSSLTQLRQLPVDELKIDRSFVSHMVDSESDRIIVRSTIDLARNLGLHVVAEGVETAEAWDLL